MKVSNCFIVASNTARVQNVEKANLQQQPQAPWILFLGSRDSVLLQWLLDQGEKVIQCEEPITSAWLKAKSIDWIISYGYRHILSDDTLAQCQGRAINLHISLLPWNRGAHPNFWSFTEGTPHGVTIHRMDAGVDTGDILCQRSIDFSNVHGVTFASSYKRLQQEIVRLFKANWVAIKTDQIQGRAQTGEGSYHDKQALTAYWPLLDQGWDTPVAAWLDKRRTHSV